MVKRENSSKFCYDNIRSSNKVPSSLTPPNINTCNMTITSCSLDSIKPTDTENSGPHFSLPWSYHSATMEKHCDNHSTKIETIPWKRSQMRKSFPLFKLPAEVIISNAKEPRWHLLMNVYSCAIRYTSSCWNPKMVSSAFNHIKLLSVLRYRNRSTKATFDSCEWVVNSL